MRMSQMLLPVQLLGSGSGSNENTITCHESKKQGDLKEHRKGVVVTKRHFGTFAAFTRESGSCFLANDTPKLTVSMRINLKAFTMRCAFRIECYKDASKYVW